MTPAERMAISVLVDALLDVRLGAEGATPQDQRAQTRYYAERLLRRLIEDDRASLVAGVLVGQNVSRMKFGKKRAALPHDSTPGAER